MSQLTEFTVFAAHAMAHPEPRYPNSSQKQLWDILLVLRAGVRLTVAKAMAEHGVYALSQRVGELKLLGWPVRSQIIALPSGKRVAEYSL